MGDHSTNGRKPNRLINERSPYLQQHAYNPVDWYPWASEAFERARAEAKPIFLSIGYATCHWCHVMERESFENESVAEFLNQHFISIKVDREELPDIDHVYMSAVQALSGSGGWPMTLFLAPDLKPFFAGTYFPPISAYGRPGFTDLLQRVAELWGTERVKLLESSEALTRAISSGSEVKEASASTLSWKEIADRTAEYFKHSYDPVLGGFGSAPKFPRPVQFEFLFDHAFRTRDSASAEMALSTLSKMAAGGMYDQLGGGFHRYSVDAKWLVPHFEKMLYDQAQLVESYLDAFQITGDRSFAEVAQGICDYVLRDLTHPDGGFFSAEDADSEGVEGTFYVWRLSEIVDLLGADRTRIVADRYGVTEEGNFEHRTNVLHRLQTLEQLAQKYNRTKEEIKSVLAESKSILLAHRGTRPRPLRDEKILTGWNGLMIAALARAGSVLDRPDYLTAAKRAAEFIWANLRTADGVLQHRWRDGEARFDGYLESYAFLIKGLLSLNRSTFEDVWLSHAVELQEQQDERLWDRAEGAYFMSTERSDLLFRVKGDYDGAEPNGNSVAVGNLLRLHALTGQDAFKEKAGRTADYYRNRVADRPYAMPLLIVDARTIEEPELQIVLSGEEQATIEMRNKIDQHYLGNAVVFRATKSSPLDEFYQSLASDGEAVAYLCKDFTCELPMNESTLTTKLNSIGFRWRAT